MRPHGSGRSALAEPVGGEALSAHAAHPRLAALGSPGGSWRGVAWGVGAFPGSPTQARGEGAGSAAGAEVGTGATSQPWCT